MCASFAPCGLPPCRTDLPVACILLVGPPSPHGGCAAHPPAVSLCQGHGARRLRSSAFAGRVRGACPVLPLSRGLRDLLVMGLPAGIGAALGGGDSGHSEVSFSSFHGPLRVRPSCSSVQRCKQLLPFPHSPPLFLTPLEPDRSSLSMLALKSIRAF